MPEGPEPVDYRGQTLSLILPVLLDRSPTGTRFGNVVTQPPAVVRRGDTIRASFVSISC